MEGKNICKHLQQFAVADGIRQIHYTRFEDFNVTLCCFSVSNDQ